MGGMVRIQLWAWIILDFGMCSDSLPDINDRKFIDEYVVEHNKARSSVSPAASNMLYMTWDEGLAITARAWARHCTFEHNIYLEDVRRVHPTFDSVGENIWTGYPPSYFQVKTAIESWVGEQQHYDYDRNTCAKVCGHYTQVVWANSYKVGCAAQLCPNGVKHTEFGARKAVIFVCNYAPAGNMNRRRPYETQGSACSGCKGTCVENLCRDKRRDAEKSYTWKPDWDASPGNSNTNSNYVTILVVRPIALILTIIAAYVVCYFYPDVFCYE